MLRIVDGLRKAPADSTLPCNNDIIALVICADMAITSVSDAGKIKGKLVSS